MGGQRCTRNCVAPRVVARVVGFQPFFFRFRHVAVVRYDNLAFIIIFGCFSKAESAISSNILFPRRTFLLG